MGAGGASAAVPGLIQRAQGYGKGDFKLLARRAAGGLLDIDSPGFIETHAKLDGQFQILTELICDLTSQLTGLIQDTKRLREKTFGKYDKFLDNA